MITDLVFVDDKLRGLRTRSALSGKGAVGACLTRRKLSCDFLTGSRYILRDVDRDGRLRLAEVRAFALDL